MWKTQQQSISNNRVFHVSIEKENSPLSYKDVIHLWEQSESFRDYYIDLMLNSPFSAYRWETPQISLRNVDKPFEFVMLDSPGLERESNPQSFLEYFQGKPSGSVVRFQNLRKDAILVVPGPAEESDCYNHIGSFTKHAPRSQQHELWMLVGNSIQERLSDTPVWVSTVGAGVPWLHIRLDDRPKYYSYKLYRDSA